MVGQRGRVLIPKEVRRGAGLDEGTVVRVEMKDEAIVIKRLRKAKRSWKRICGIVPERTVDTPTAEVPVVPQIPSRSLLDEKNDAVHVHRMTQTVGKSVLRFSRFR